MKNIILSLLIAVSSVCIAFAEDLYLIPFGDSITEGYRSWDYFGWRGWMQGVYMQTPVYDWVGSLKNPASHDTLDVDHEGHSGWRTDEILGIVTPRLTTYMSAVDGPNSKALIMAGTNDLMQDYGTGTADDKLNAYAANVREMISRIHAFNPDIEVYVSTIIPMRSGQSGYENVSAYNTKLRNMIATEFPYKPNLCLVDSEAQFLANPDWATAWMYDDVHPNDSGYEQISISWSNAIKAFRYPHNAGLSNPGATTAALDGAENSIIQ